jgi:hypothetical protein
MNSQSLSRPLDPQPRGRAVARPFQHNQLSPTMGSVPRVNIPPPRNDEPPIDPQPGTPPVPPWTPPPGQHPAALSPSQAAPPSWLSPPPYPGAGLGPAPAPARHRGQRAAIGITLAVLVAVGLIVGLGSAHSTSRASHPGGSPTATPVLAPTGSVLYTSSVSHFRARFPAAPKTVDLPTTIGSVQLTIHIVAVRRPELALVEDEQFAVTLPSSQYADTMRIALTSTATPGNWTIESQTPTTFHGKLARTASYVTPQGTHLSGLVFIQSAHELYEMVGQSDAAFSDLKDTFTVIP